MAKAGFHPPEIVLNGKFYRFPFDKTDHKNSAWLIGNRIDGDLIVATFGNWRTGEHHVFSPKVPTEHKKRFAQEQKKLIDDIEKQKAEEADRAAIDAVARMKACEHGRCLTPYLKRKGIRELFGARPSADEKMGAHLAIPMYNAQGELRGVQRTTSDGVDRKFISGTAVHGLFHALKGDVRTSDVIYIAEGFATTATIAQALVDGCFVCAFSAGNLEHCARAIVGVNSQAHIIICADNDETGIKAAERAALAVNGEVKLCPVEGSDFNDIGEEATRAALETAEIVKRDTDGIVLDMFTGKDSLDSLKMKVACEGRVLFDSNRKSWYHFDKVWHIAEDSDIDTMFMRTMDCGYPDGYGMGKYKPFFDATKRRLTQRVEWNSSKTILPFVNGMLDLSTMILHPHSPEFYFNWHVPYAYDPDAKCPRTDLFLKELSHGDTHQEEILLVFLAALMRGRADLQRYLELIGHPGTGKTTYIKIAQKLVGLKNAMITSMSNMGSRFETAGFFGKRLVFITDAEHYSHSTDIFKSLTGQDPLRYELKNKDVGEPFVFDGMVIVAANTPIQFDDKSTAIARRRITVSIEKPLKVTDSRINEKLEKELPGLVNRLLDIPEEWIESVLTAATNINSKFRNQAFVDTNAVGQWIEDSLILSSESSLKNGTLKKLSNGEFEFADTQLYPNYLRWCSREGRKPLSSTVLGRALREIIATYKWPVEHKKTNTGKHYFGLRIKRSDEAELSIFNL